MKEITKFDTLKIVGKNIKRIRLLKGFSQENLASDLQKSVNFISLIERGESGLSISTIVDICKVLNVDANTIFEGIIPAQKIEPNDFILKSLDSFNKKDKQIVIELINYIICQKERRKLKSILHHVNFLLH